MGEAEGNTGGGEAMNEDGDSPIKRLGLSDNNTVLERPFKQPRLYLILL